MGERESSDLKKLQDSGGRCDMHRSPAQACDTEGCADIQIDVLLLCTNLSNEGDKLKTK